MLDPLEITVADLEEDRYSRLRLIPWWDQSKLKNAKVMVVGAGALGNEVIKNLALVGVGNILIIDMDIIENSNLSRSVLFRAEDCGRLKAEVAAERAMEINPDINVTWMNADIVNDVGLGVFACMDVVIGGLDNREARLAINQSCWKVNVPWVDGAIEVLHGVARVFVPPDGACYECTMGRSRLPHFKCPQILHPSQQRRDDFRKSTDNSYHCIDHCRSPSPGGFKAPSSA